MIISGPQFEVTQALAEQMQAEMAISTQAGEAEEAAACDFVSTVTAFARLVVGIGSREADLLTRRTCRDRRYPVVIEANDGQAIGLPILAEGDRATAILFRLQERSRRYGTNQDRRERWRHRSAGGLAARVLF